MAKSNKNFGELVGRVVIGDVIALAIATSLSAWLNFAWFSDSDAHFLPGQNFRIIVSPFQVSTAMFIFWLITLFVLKAWNPRFVLVGIPEYVTVAKSAAIVLLALSFGVLALKFDVSRLFVFDTAFIGALALVANRWLILRWLKSSRRRGRYLRSSVIVGHADEVKKFVEKLLKQRGSGYTPTSVLLLQSKSKSKLVKKLEEQKISVFFYDGTDLSSVLSGVDAVIAIGTDLLDAERIQEISRVLEGSKTEFFVAPALLEMAGNRVTTHPIDGYNFLYIETPKFDGYKYFFKTAFDIVIATLALVLLSPVFIATSLAVWLGDRGPIFYLQERIGKDGKTFKIVKFRSMIQNADSQQAKLLENSKNLKGNKTYKDPKDPRLTRVGAFIRKWSIDELPQLFNVLNGTMSIVGPRPQVQREVEAYEGHAKRRLLVKTGITGLWQVSGRSLLTWDESISLDLFYVENWSLLGDIFIILRTFSAVLTQQGAY